MIRELFNRTVENSGDEYIVRYMNGEYSGKCVYHRVEKVGKQKPIRQEFFIMVDCDMGDIVEGMNKKSPLTSEDMIKVQREIREDSLEVVKEFFQPTTIG